MVPEEQRRVGARIAVARRAKGLSQRELAARLGVTVRTLQNYESGRHIPYKYLHAIEGVTGAWPGWILHGEDSETPHGEKLSTILATLNEQRQVLAHQLQALRTQRVLLKQLRERHSLPTFTERAR